MMPDAIILAGGKGTRLRGVIDDRPKPMAPVCGRPFLQWLLLALRRQGVQHFVLATGYMAESIEAYFGDGTDHQMQLAYSRETMPLGTAGAARKAAEHVDSDPLLVLNGDSFCRTDVERMLQVHRNRNAAATLWLVPKQDCGRYGKVTVDGGGRIVSFCEKAIESGRGLISAGVYLLDRQLVDAIPLGAPMSLERQVFPQLVGHNLYGVVGEGPFLDIGTPESYGRSEQFLAREIDRWQLAVS